MRSRYTVDVQAGRKYLVLFTGLNVLLILRKINSTDKKALALTVIRV